MEFDRCSVAKCEDEVGRPCLLFPPCEEADRRFECLVSIGGAARKEAGGGSCCLSIGSWTIGTDIGANI